MERDPRERERGAGRSDVASLWIDFLLLPQKLEEHLAAGLAATPTPPDLISMFLEQALVNHKSALGNSKSSASLAIKDEEAQGTVRPTSKTASLLCERAARVAVVMRHTLSDIEASIPSQLHQFVLLKALIRHDKCRSVLHQCNIHRWLIHKALRSHPVGSASPNVVLPVNRLGSWLVGDDLGEVFHVVLNGNSDLRPASSTGDLPTEEERASVEFLEKILLEEESAIKDKDRNLQGVTANGGSNTEQALSTAYKCQVVLDVAEVHFMRGRIRKAHELFTKCLEMLTSLSVRELPSKAENREGFPLTLGRNDSNVGPFSEVSPVPQDRLVGFLVACKMLLGSSADGNGVEVAQPAKCAGQQDPCCVGAPSPSQWAIIACEQSRWAARKYRSNATSQSGLANGDSGSDFSSGKENAGASVSGRTSADNSLHHLSSRRSKKRTYIEDSNGDMTHKEAQLEKVGSVNSEFIRQVNESRHKEADVDDMQVDEKPVFSTKGHLEDPLSNGGEGKAHEKKGSEVEGNWDQKTVGVKDVKTGVASFSEKLNRVGIDVTEKEPVTSATGADYCSEVEFFVDLNGDPAEDVFAKVDTNMCISCAPFTKQEKNLVQTFVEDILRGHLSWAYCLAVERDPLLSKPVRSKLAACNVVRSVLEGAPVQSFLRTSGHFENSEDAVEFLLQLLLAVKVMQEGNRPPREVDSVPNGRVVELGFPKESLSGTGKRDRNVSVVTRRIQDLAIYVCCVIDKPQCWGSALKLGLVGQVDLPRFSGQLPPSTSTLKKVDGSGIFLKADMQSESFQNSYVPRLDNTELFSESEMLLSFVQVESIYEVEGLIKKVKKMGGRARALKESPAAASGKNCEHAQVLVQSDSLKLTGNHSQDATNSWLLSSKDQACMKCQVTAAGPGKGCCSSFEADVAGILRRRAFSTLRITKDVRVAKRLYELALAFQPGGDCDSAMMLWLLERSTESSRESLSEGTRHLPKNSEGDLLPTLGLLDFVILQLIEKELWGTLSEFCKWAVSLISLEPRERDGEQTLMTEKDAGVGSTQGGGTGENAAMKNTAAGQFRQKRLQQTLNIARAMVDLMPLCVSLQTAVSRNHFNEDVANLGSTLSQLFEDFLCFLVGIESDRQIQGTDDAAHSRSNQVGLGPPPYPGAPGVPLISKVSNPRALMALASLTAGWLQRCHVVGLTPWPLAVERYGVLAGVTAGASLPPPVGSLPYAASVLRPVPPRVSPEFGRDLFGVLLEGIVGLPGVVEGDREKGHRWLQGLADIAFEDEEYVKALRLYLQAGAIRSAQYCDRASSMNRDIFTPWVIQRMVAACRAIGAGLQAAVLCQCLPVPDHESAFRILQENTLIMDRDAAAYFECLWEVPILELLVHLHSRAGDEVRVASLIGLLQQPALNVHNPPAIRQAHISTMEQRFLQRLAGELL